MLSKRDNAGYIHPSRVLDEKNKTEVDRVLKYGILYVLLVSWKGFKGLLHVGKQIHLHLKIRYL